MWRVLVWALERGLQALWCKGARALLRAGAQKNVGPSGVTMVIVREDLLGHARRECPTMLDFATMAETGSMYNTPPCWAIYVCGLVFKKLLREGGLEGMQSRNAEKVGRPPPHALAAELEERALLHAVRARCCITWASLCVRFAPRGRTFSGTPAHVRLTVGAALIPGAAAQVPLCEPGRLAQRGHSQAAKIYDAIAASGGFYNSPVDPAVRSMMNVPFTIPSNPDLEAAFVKEAAASNLVRASCSRPLTTFSSGCICHLDMLT